MSINIREGEDTKRKILLAAKTEFAVQGFSGARMSSIAAIAGVNQALLHYYFKGKENIYRIIIQKLIGDISEVYGRKIISEIVSWNAPPDIKLCAVIYVLVNSGNYVCDDEFHKIIAHEMAENNGIIHEFIREYMLPQLLSIDEIVRAGVSDGIFEVSDTTLFSISMILFIRDLAHGEEFFKDTDLYERVYGKKFDELYNYMLEFAFKTLRPEGKNLKIPDLGESKKNRLVLILKEMGEEIKKF